MVLQEQIVIRDRLIPICGRAAANVLSELVMIPGPGTVPYDDVSQILDHLLELLKNEEKEDTGLAMKKKKADGNEQKK